LPNTTQRTPGLWEAREYQEDAGSPIEWHVNDAEGNTIADCGFNEANARLIAAAPIMAERIQGALDSLSQNKAFPSDIENAKRLLIDALQTSGIEPLPLDRAAIAKARGQT
jgi:hypothetical protein